MVRSRKGESEVNDFSGGGAYRAVAARNLKRSTGQVKEQSMPADIARRKKNEPKRLAQLAKKGQGP